MLTTSNLLHVSFPSAMCLSQDATADPPSQKSLPFEHQLSGLGQNRWLWSTVLNGESLLQACWSGSENVLASPTQYSPNQDDDCIQNLLQWNVNFFLVSRFIYLCTVVPCYSLVWWGIKSTVLCIDLFLGTFFILWIPISKPKGTWTFIKMSSNSPL